MAGAAWYWAETPGAGRERLWHATRDALDLAAPTFLQGTEIAEGSAREAAALLVLELAYADPVLTPADRELVAGHLRERWGLEAGRSDGGARPRGGAPHPVRALRRPPAPPFRPGQRLELVERMWTVAFGEGAIGAQEDRVMSLAAELLDVGPAEVAEIRRRLQGGGQR